MSYQNYLNFFAKHSFASNAHLEFFKDGSFAIKTDEGIKLYDNNCNEVGTLSGGRYEILSNGIIVKICSNTILMVCDGIKKLDKVYQLHYHDQSSVIVSGSMIFFRKCANYSHQHAVYEISKTGAPIEKKALDFVDGAVFSASSDGSVYAIGKHGNMSVFNQQGENIFGEDVSFCHIDVLSCGSFIVHTGSFKYKLYNSDGELLCTASSLRPIGSSYLLFEEALIINAANGTIESEYDNEIKKVAIDGTRVYSHKLVNKNGTGYMLGGKLLPSICTERWRPSFSVILSQNRFYVLNLYNNMDFLDGPMNYISNLLMIKPH